MDPSRRSLGVVWMPQHRPLPLTQLEAVRRRDGGEKQGCSLLRNREAPGKNISEQASCSREGRSLYQY